MKTSLEIMMGIRNYWRIKPVTKIHGTGKGYDRRKQSETSRREVEDFDKNNRRQTKQECKQHIDVKV